MLLCTKSNGISRMRIPSLLLWCVALGASCQSSGVDSSSGADRLARWMSGNFSSASQAAAAPEDYFDIRLVMVEIWAERADGPWLYVEQAAASALDRPYRQRVYRLVDTPEGVRSDVFLLPGDALAFAGAWRTPDSFDTLEPAALVEREGCSIYLVERDGAFEGSTRGDSCSSELRGATYATSEVRIEPDLLTSWDRGWDQDGVQVWGAELGPYEFVREPTLGGGLGVAPMRRAAAPAR